MARSTNFAVLTPFGSFFFFWTSGGVSVPPATLRGTKEQRRDRLEKSENGFSLRLDWFSSPWWPIVKPNGFSWIFFHSKIWNSSFWPFLEIISLTRIDFGELAKFWRPRAIREFLKTKNAKNVVFLMDLEMKKKRRMACDLGENREITFSNSPKHSTDHWECKWFYRLVQIFPSQIIILFV